MGAGFVIQPTVFWRRSAMRARDDFADGLRYVGDLDMWLSMAPEVGFRRIDEFMAIDHRHADTLSVASRSAMAAEAAPVRNRHRHGHLG